MEKNKSVDRGALIGAAFLMATSAIGPGFLTQTAYFTEIEGANFGFVILISVIIVLIAQLNIWRVLSVTGKRGQDVANEILPGLGYVLAYMVAFGGLVFNIGNVGGAGIGLSAIIGVDIKIATAIGGIIGILIFLSKSAGKVIDRLTTILGAVMIVLILIVAIQTRPPLAEAVKRTFLPTSFPFMAILTLVGGTVGGYIPFSGGHRLIDAGITGEKNLKRVNGSAYMGIGVAAIVRVLLFLAVLGVVASGNSLDPNNPAGSAFHISLGDIGIVIFGIIMFAAALSSIVGSAFTSVSFLKTLHKPVAKYESAIIIIFIAISTIISITVGSPATVLVLAGTINGFILPVMLAILLIASRKKSIVGEYKHSTVLFVLGWVVVGLTAILTFVTVRNNLATLFKPAAEAMASFNLNV